jgi:hypothetical protein
MQRITLASTNGMQYFASMKNNSAFHYFVFQWRHSVWVCCLSYLILSWGLFSVTGLLSADALEMGFSSQDQLMGMILLMMVMPTWMIGCMFVTQRHSMSIARRLSPQLVVAIGEVPQPYVWSGLVAGLLYALAFNVPTGQYSQVFAGNGPMISVFIGQVLIWLGVGVLIAIRLYIGGEFYRAGEIVKITIFEQAQLESFARVGMLDVAIVVGCMVVATVQSIDAQFRVVNYLTALLVAVPAAVALLMRPMWSVHRRLQARKQELMKDIQEKIEAAPEQGDDASIAALECLLRRRDRINALHTWPLDFAIWSRLFFYGLIPPLAWLGAAVAEILVQGLLDR